ncbi:MAG: VWA domain-containing protein [Terriglobia bacterium]
MHRTRNVPKPSILLPYMAALVILLFVPAVGAALQSKPQSQSKTAQAPPIVVNVNVVPVPFTVTNKKNQIVTDLTKNDFEVFEDGKPQTITLFSRETNLPLRIGVLIDTSNSIRERLEFEKQAAVDFLDATLRPGLDQAFVVGFDVEPQLLQDYTDDLDRLSTAIRSLQAGGGTGLFDAVYYAAKQKMIYSPPPQPYLRRVLVIVSDGRDNESQHSLDEALAMAQRAEAIVFAVSTNRSGIEERGDKVLTEFADQTGGRAFFPFEASDLASAFATISKELRGQYMLTYISTNKIHDGKFRHIRIKALEKGLRVRARAGYFAPSQ